VLDVDTDHYLALKSSFEDRIPAEMQLPEGASSSARKIMTIVQPSKIVIL